MKKRTEDILLVAVLCLFLGVFLGYAWRMVQVSGNEVEAFREGKIAGERMFIKTLFFEAENQNTFFVAGLKVMPRKDGAILIRKAKQGGVK